MMRGLAIFAACALCALVAGCSALPETHAAGSAMARRGDEIVIAGQFFHTGAPVVLWLAPGGYDAYRVERRFARPEEAGWEHIKGALGSPNRYGDRLNALPDERREQVRQRGWTLDDVRDVVDQFVIHYDVCGTSRGCFRVLHDARGLSVHFMIDIDGTIYQTLDVKERAWHATIANDRSVGVELAHIGAYASAEAPALAAWYERDAQGWRISIPPELGDGGVRTSDFVGRPAREDWAQGTINGSRLIQPDFTPEQYRSLAALTDTLCTVLPRIDRRVPRDEAGRVLNRALTAEEFASFRGVLGHWHVQANKIDPGPALDWDRVLGLP